MDLLLTGIWSRSSMDRMADSGSVGWAFESPRDHKAHKKATDNQWLFISPLDLSNKVFTLINTETYSADARIPVNSL